MGKEWTDGKYVLFISLMSELEAISCTARSEEVWFIAREDNLQSKIMRPFENDALKIEKEVYSNMQIHL